MSGGSKAKTSSSTDSSITTVDQSGVEANQLNTVTGDRNTVSTTDQSGNTGVLLDDVRARDLTITSTDHDAVSGSLDFARDIGSEAFGFGESAFLFADAAGERSAQQSAAALAKTGEAIDQVGLLAQTFKDGASSKMLLWVGFGIGTVAIVTVLAVTYGSKN